SACAPSQKSRTQTTEDNNYSHPQGTTSGAHIAATRNAPKWQKTADAIIFDGMRYMGTPYVYGAERFNDKAFDCSSYVQY
ncbi:hypothetical protein MXD81_25580, partial [Microbacteriaceae bacterium K1510]|nr:hypothetical protein [Microbacteriaceae bacterium K1510]